MFSKNNKTFRFTPINEAEKRFMDMFKRRNGMAGNRRFNDMEIRGKRTILHMANDYKTIVDTSTISEILQRGKVSTSYKKANVYARIGTKGQRIDLHRFVMRHELAEYEGFEATTGFNLQIHHKNENPLDNRKSNLEVVTTNENLLLKSNIKGYYETPSGKFVSHLMRKRLGTFDTIEEAVKVRDKAVKKELRRLKKIRKDFLRMKSELNKR